MIIERNLDSMYPFVIEEKQFKYTGEKKKNNSTRLPRSISNSERQISVASQRFAALADVPTSAVWKQRRRKKDKRENAGGRRRRRRRRNAITR